MQATLNGHHQNTISLVIDPTLAPPISSYVNPSQILSQSPQTASTSSDFLSSSLKRKSPANTKRRRTDTPDESGDSSQHHKNRDRPKKKKANRACFHCQKAHLTCDDSRPCQRCIKRGISTSCTEGHRKKAKYLLDEDELEQLKRSKSSTTENSMEPPSISACEPFPSTDSLFDPTFDTRFTFGSEAANSEYSMLSAILGTSSPIEPQTTPPPSLQYPSALSDPSWPASQLSQHQFPPENTIPSYGELSIQPSDSRLNSSALPSNYVSSYEFSQQLNSSQDPQLQYPQQFRSQPPLHSLHPRYNPSDLARNPPKEAFSTAIISPALSHHSPTSSTSAPIGCSDLTAGGTPLPHLSQNSQLQNINDHVTAPHDYTEGYHFLMKHLPTRFEKNDILRIVRALAIYRPSLIALQMPLSEDDEVFVERCFQRSLLELDKLISYSGTPTVVWRRTGEICLVAPEFSLLTEWSREELLNRRKYIYELFENQSVVEYFESFALHAFENTTKSVNSHCVLLKPSGGPIPCTFCFSVRRDLFDLPSHVIGQWLPLL